MGSSHLICSFIGVVVLLWKPTGFSAASRINVALSGTAIQSTTISDSGKAEHSIDGNTDPVWSHTSCSRTEEEAEPWWRLELPGVYRVSEIQVTNRETNRERLNGIEILIGNSLVNNGNDNSRCAIINDDPGCLTQTVKCWGMEGRACCTLHEHSGDGEEHHSGGDAAVLVRRPALLQRLSLGPAKLLGPEDQEMVDELVARTPFPLTSHLWVGLRRSLSGSSWFWMSGDPMDFSQWDDGSHHPSPVGACPAWNLPHGGNAPVKNILTSSVSQVQQKE
ncbi:unnamed protein product [Gadus morhua 'NCC']